jgi:hypothetical protein
MHALRISCVALGLLSILAAQDEQPRPLRFGWPAPARARVTEVIPGEGAPAIELSYLLDFGAEEPGSPTTVRFSDFAFARLGSDSLSGTERAQFVAMTVPGLVVRPELVIDSRGRVTGMAGFEPAARRMLALIPSIAPAITPDLRTRIENEWLTEQARDLAEGRVQADWEAWVGAWIGFVPVRAEAEPVAMNLRHGGVDVPAESTLERVPDVSLDEYEVRLRSTIVAGGSEARDAMQRVVDEQERQRVARDGGERRDRKVLRYEIQDVVEAVVDRRTLRPSQVRIRRTREVAVENEETSRRVEDRRFTFEWLESGR